MEIFKLIKPQYYLFCFALITGYSILWLIRKKEWSFYIWFTVVATTVAISLYVVAIIAGFTSLAWPYSFIIILPVLLALIPVFLIIYRLSKKTIPHNSFKSIPHKIFVVFFLLFLLVFPGWLYNQKNTKTITFYAADQFHNPVSNLLIRYETSKIPTLTNENGYATINFPVNNFPVNRFPYNNEIIDCEEISRKGYEIEGGQYDYNSGRDRGTYNYNIGSATELGFPYRVNIFMRKKEKSSFLLKDSWWFSLVNKRENEIADNLWKFTRKNNSYLTPYNNYKKTLAYSVEGHRFHLDYDNPRRKHDVIFEFENIRDQKEYLIKISAPLEGNGSVLLDEKLHIGPKDGYLPELSFRIKYGQETKKFLYFKSRKLSFETESGEEYRPIYSRMELKITSADEEGITIRHETWTNPYGVPNFEYDSDMWFDIRNYLRSEVNRAFREGRMPPEPDIEEIIASGKHLN